MIDELISSFLGKLIADDLREWAPKAAVRLIRVAVKNIPVEQRARCLEEWTGDLERCSGTLTKLILSLNFFRAAWSIRRESERSKRLTLQLTADKIYNLFALAIIRERPELELVSEKSRNRFVDEVLSEYLRGGGIVDFARAAARLDRPSITKHEAERLMRRSARRVLAQIGNHK